MTYVGAWTRVPLSFTLVYSIVGKLEIKLDLYLPRNINGTLPNIISSMMED